MLFPGKVSNERCEAALMVLRRWFAKFGWRNAVACWSAEKGAVAHPRRRLIGRDNCVARERSPLSQHNARRTLCQGVARRLHVANDVLDVLQFAPRRTANTRR
jgi:hypothetical protein